jgi:hypothetical protein
MAAFHPAPTDKSSAPTRETDMGVASLARAHLGIIVKELAPGVPLKSAFARVGALLGMKARRVKMFWNEEVSSPRHKEMEALERELARISERELTTGIMKHAARLEGYASRLALSNPDLHSEEIDRLRNLARRVRNVLADEEVA